jgi:pullulanase/glycogen debranching enzyme
MINYTSTHRGFQKEKKMKLTLADCLAQNNQTNHLNQTKQAQGQAKKKSKNMGEAGLSVKAKGSGPGFRLNCVAGVGG